MLRQVFTGPKSIVMQTDETEIKKDFISLSTFDTALASSNNLSLDSFSYTADTGVQARLATARVNIKSAISPQQQVDVKNLLKDKKQTVLTDREFKKNLIDLSPRELFICSALLVPVLLFGSYPKSFTVFYETRVTDFINQVQKVKKESVVSKPIFKNENYENNINFTEYFL